MSFSSRAALAFDRRFRQWESQTAEPMKAQQELLRELIHKNRDTAFGRDHGFASIRTIDDYRKHVPIDDYERFRSYIERATNGESAMLTQEPVLMFTMTSGSTGAPKLIPVTETTRAAHAQLTQLWYGNAFADHAGCAAGKVFGLVGAAEEGRTPGGIPYGAASGLIYRSSPQWIKDAHSLPYEIAEIKDFDSKYYTAMRLGLEQSVTFLGTPNPSTILRLVDTADRFKTVIVKDIHDGTLSPRIEVANEIRQALGTRLTANPQRAQELEGFIQTQDRLRPQEYWPSLKLIGCWKGGSVGLRLQEFSAWFGDEIPVRDLGYMASEAQMSLPISDKGAAGILAIDVNFYEFIPESEIDSPQRATLTCEELELGAAYYLILTTAGGLYRYDINDVIRVVGFHGKTPLIEFLRKGRDVTSITGEKLHVNQLIEAMEKVQQLTKLPARHFRAVADAIQSRYRILVEFADNNPSNEQQAAWLAELDRQLQSVNIEYAQKRQSKRLAFPLLHCMKLGWWERQQQTSVRQGGRDIQFKARLLTDTMDDENEIAATVECDGSAAS